MKWYVMQVKTGEEAKARDALLRIDIPAKVPQEKTAIRKSGAWGTEERVLFPGYVFMGCENFGADEYYAAIKTPAYIRFLGRINGQAAPEAISYLEAEYIGLLAPTTAPLSPSIVKVGGDTPVIVSGVLQSIPGKIVKYNLRQKRARVLLSVLGEEKQVDFSIVVEGEPASEQHEGIGDGE